MLRVFNHYDARTGVLFNANVAVLVNSSGVAEMQVAAPITANCYVDMSDFPFDKHTCWIYLGLPYSNIEYTIAEKGKCSRIVSV